MGAVAQREHALGTCYHGVQQSCQTHRGSLRQIPGVVEDYGSLFYDGFIPDIELEPAARDTGRDRASWLAC